MELLQRKTWKYCLILSFIFIEVFAKPQSGICQTEGCNTASSGVIDAMDTTVDPCDNFYNFACGNYIKHTNLIDENDDKHVMEKISNKVKEQLRTIVSGPIDQNDIKPNKLVKQFYSQCMDGKSGVSSFLEIVDQFGGWPILKGESWEENEFNLEHLFSEIQNYEFKNKLQLRRAYESLNSFSNTKKYRTFMNDFINLFESSNPDKSQELDDIFNFEEKLENLIIKFNVTTILLNVRDFQPQNTHVNWTNLLNDKIPADVIDFSNRIDPEFFMSAGKLIMSTPNRTLANFLAWNFAKFSAKYLTKDMNNLSVQYFSPNKIEARWEFCLEEVKNNLKYPLSAMYINKHFDKSSKPKVIGMIKAIQEEADNFFNSFGIFTWKNEKTRMELVKKLMNLEFKYVGFLNELMDSVKMKKNYENFSLPKNLFLSSLKCMVHKDTEKYSDRFYDAMDEMLPFAANAFYLDDSNSINFPAGYLQSPMYNSNRPQYLNYGALGWTIGHEISHMLQDGRKYLGEDRVNCLINQYSSYFEPLINKTLNGAKTIREDLADNIGMKIAYHSYKSYVYFKGDEFKLPGLNYSPEQLFWIAGAQRQCAKFGVGRAEELFNNDKHTLAPWRVIGTFRNMVEFSKDFQCSKNTKMNPSKRCEIWK